MHQQSCSHHHHHHHAVELQTKGLKLSLLIISIFLVLEVIAAAIANSLALISDALHLFTDLGALLLSLIVVNIARLPKTQKRTYGYHRAEILGALASSLSLWALCGVVIYEGIKRLLAPPEVQGFIVMIIAFFGLLANILLIRVLHPIQEHGLHMRSAYLHVLGDLLASIGVIAAGLILWLTSWNPIDPILSIAFACSILYSSGKIIKESVSILMESAPKGINPEDIEKDLLSIAGVKEVHNLHIWSISSKRVALSAHIVAKSPHTALNEAHRIIEKNYHIHYMTIQVEDPAHYEPKYCYDREKKH